jgi:hypothetical protein
MTKKQEKIWAYKVKHPEATISEIAQATKTSYAYVWALMKKIGTPKEVLVAEKQLEAAGITDIEAEWAGVGTAGFYEDVSHETIAAGITDIEPEKPPALPPLYNRSVILDRASGLISGDRHEEYGDAKENFERIAGYWNAHLGLINFISARDVAAMMVLLKISRLHGDGPKDVDTYVDICGYAAIGGEIASGD